jgi:ATP-dependent DNA helicase RecQ
MTELKKDTECTSLFNKRLPIGDYEDVLLYLNTIGALKLERELLICYSPMSIEKLEKNSRRHYSKQEYKKLEDYYRNKTEQIHIVGEYARMKLKGHEGAIRFIDDYFSLPYPGFIKKYFPRRKSEIRHPITKEGFKRLFSALSTEQMNIIKDNRHKRILVAAGPGSGKTRVLVHKVASLLLLEDVKPEQFLMLTFKSGEIKLVKYKSPNLIAPLVKDIMKSGLTGATAVLTRTNEEALLVENLLNQEGAPAKLISSRKGFSLGELLEIKVLIIICQNIGVMN